MVPANEGTIVPANEETMVRKQMLSLLRPQKTSVAEAKIFRTAAREIMMQKKEA